MQRRYQRYAIYWTPPAESALAKFGALWFGGLSAFGVAPQLAQRAIAAPALYGVHATFKAPFRLRDGVRLEALCDALDAFCAKRRAPRPARLIMGDHQRYLTLMLDKEADVDWLGAECVTHFDRFRAPLNEEDKKRRELAGMSAREEIFLAEFGYPYVLSAFRFHISLAGYLEKAELDEAATALAPHLDTVLSEPFEIEDLTLLGEPRNGGVFEEISRHPFGPHLKSESILRRIS